MMSKCCVSLHALLLVNSRFVNYIRFCIDFFDFSPEVGRWNENRYCH